LVCVHELRELRRPKRTRAPRRTAGLALIRSLAGGGQVHARHALLTARSCGSSRRDLLDSRAARRPSARAGCPNCRYRRSRFAVLEAGPGGLDHRDDVLLRSVLTVSSTSSSRRMFIHAAHGRTVDALGVKEQACEQRPPPASASRACGASPGRMTAVDVRCAGWVASPPIVASACADQGAGVAVVDLSSSFELVDSRRSRAFQMLGTDSSPRLDVDLARSCS